MEPLARCRRSTPTRIDAPLLDARRVRRGRATRSGRASTRPRGSSGSAFARIASALGRQTWDAPVTRIEAGARLLTAAPRDAEGVVAAQRARRRPRPQQRPRRPRRWCCGSETAAARGWRWCSPRCRRSPCRSRRGGGHDPRPRRAAARARRPPRGGPAVAELGDARPARHERRPAPQRRLPRDGAAGRVRGAGARAGGPRPAQRDLRALRARGHRRVDHVDFPNSDRTYHNVFSLSKTKRFDLGRYPRGQSRSVRFDQPGRRPRLLRDPLAHERLHPGLRAPLLRDHRRRGPLPDRRRAARAPTRSPLWNDGRGARRRGGAGRAPTGEAVEADFVVE